MSKGVKLVVAVASVLLMVSCNRNSVFKGFDRMETGAYMRFYEKHSEGEMPRIGDGVTFEMAQYFNDSMLFTTADDKPLEIVLKPADYVGDVSDALLAMHVGDSARLVVLSDSVFVTVMHVDVPEEYMGKPIYYDMKLLSIKPLEVIAAERKAMLDSLCKVENDYLMALQADPKNTVTESGLIVIDKKGKGKVAKLGDYVDFDLILCGINGDTMINSYGMEPIEMQYGEEFICKGLDEALGMVPEGGEMNVVIPSSLGFDSTGYNRLIMPYAPLVAKLHMNEILDQAAYEAKQARLEAEKEAEKERLLALEGKLMEQYIQENNITVEPTETGVYIIPIEAGEGELAKWGDKVSVYYTLNNLKGDLIESGYDFGEPIAFTIGQGEMIPAIEDAVMTMAPGAKVMIVTPSDQAFGEIELDEKLPSYSPLMIELELVSIEE